MRREKFRDPVQTKKRQARIDKQLSDKRAEGNIERAEWIVFNHRTFKITLYGKEGREPLTEKEFWVSLLVIANKRIQRYLDPVKARILAERLGLASEGLDEAAEKERENRKE